MKNEPFAEKMMPGEEPYTEAERKQRNALVRDAASGDPGEAGEAREKLLAVLNAKYDVHEALMRYGAQYEPERPGYPYLLATPLGVLRVSPYEPATDAALWIHARFDDVHRAQTVLGDLSMNGKWNFTSHVEFLAALQRYVFRTRASRVADEIYSAWRKLFDEIMPPSFAPAPYSPGFGANPAIRECANNSVIEEDAATCAVFAREAITPRSRDGRWPLLTEEQIERFVAVANEVERNVK